jgi:hypothetical protein
MGPYHSLSSAEADKQTTALCLPHAITGRAVSDGLRTGRREWESTLNQPDPPNVVIAGPARLGKHTTLRAHRIGKVKTCSNVGFCNAHQPPPPPSAMALPGRGQRRTISQQRPPLSSSAGFLGTRNYRPKNGQSLLWTATFPTTHAGCVGFTAGRMVSSRL